MISQIVRGDYIENPLKQLQLGVYLAILIITAAFILLLFAAIIHNSWQYGHKQFKFRESYFLAGFYVSAGINMIVQFWAVCTGIALVVYHNNVFKNFDFSTIDI
jgi:hypothetical protein